MLEWLLNVVSEWQALLVGIAIGLLGGIALRRITGTFFVWCAGHPRLRIIRTGLRKIGCPLCWLYYCENSNAVVESHIRDCGDYVRMHFSDGEEGEIWLYNSDLQAFLGWDDFKELYLACIAPNDRVAKVKVLLDRDEIKSLISNEEWETVRDNLAQHDAVPLAAKLKYCFMDELPQARKRIVEDGDFKLYTARDSFIFYTRGASLVRMEAVCVHRRLKGDENDNGDLRITVTAARKRKQTDAFVKFMQPDWQDKFQGLFADGAHWKPFSELVKAQLEISP
ncbi:MAG: hypothetical protein HND57_03180 [Planctomycetes bacterium]|nr:hypothetical protein [Planctomycetota bacterium]